MNRKITTNPSKHVVRALLAGALLAASGAGALEAKPERLTITSDSEPVTLGITHNGAAVAAVDIGAVKLYVDQHDYDHMIVVNRADGQITIHPTPELELGMYDLAVQTTHGELRVPVTALQQIADQGLEARAKRQGVTVDDIRAQLGMSQTVGQERITLGLGEAYYLGQTLRIAMEVAAPRTAEWTVNGEKVDAPGGALAYTFDQPGVYDFAYVEKQGGRAVAMGLGTTTVIAEPPVPVTVNAGVKQTLAGPTGYGKYAWKIDGNEAGTGSTWTGTFESPGKHTATVRAETPDPGTAQVFREITFEITVP